MALVIEKTETLPGVSRAGRNSEEINLLKDAVRSEDANVIRNVEKSNFPAFQQRIRYAASEIGMKVSIHRSNDSDPGTDDGTVDVHFQGKVPVAKTSSKK